jgi:NADH:quinone reductase (non-electrogenic)
MRLRCSSRGCATLCFWGVLAWLLWLGVHIYFLIGFANRLLVMIQWGLSFLTKRLGVRIVSQQSESVYAHEC